MATKTKKKTTRSFEEQLNMAIRKSLFKDIGGLIDDAFHQSETTYQNLEEEIDRQFQKHVYPEIKKYFKKNKEQIIEDAITNKLDRMIRNI